MVTGQSDWLKESGPVEGEHAGFAAEGSFLPSFLRSFLPSCLLWMADGFQLVDSFTSFLCTDRTVLYSCERRNDKRRHESSIAHYMLDSFSMPRTSWMAVLLVEVLTVLSTLVVGPFAVLVVLLLLWILDWKRAANANRQ